MKGSKIQRIGMYAGTFDPVHAGHVSFALYAQQIARLDSVYFLPERKPRYKPHVQHFAHRVKMIKEAIIPYPSLGVVELVDSHFTVKRTLPSLKSRFGDCQLVFLFGSDVFLHIPNWSYAHVLADSAEFVVSVRKNDNVSEIEKIGTEFTGKKNGIIVLDSLYPDVSSKQIRDAISQNNHAPGSLESVKKYALKEWLYTNI